MPDVSGDDTRIATSVGHVRDVTHRMSDEGVVHDFPTLKWSWQGAGDPVDMPFVIGSVRVVSPRVRTVFDGHLGPADELQWLPAVVADRDGDEHPYWVPHFPVHDDVLDLEHTTWGPSGLPVRYVYSASKLEGHAVTVYSVRARTVQVRDRTITLPSETPPLIYVISAEVAEALRAADITGARITPAPVSYEPDPRS